MNITRGKKSTAKKIVIYGTEGIGKSTFASKFPNPLFIDTEDSTKDMDVARFDKPTSWEMLLQQVKYVLNNPECCRTLVIDTADWAEQLEIASLCAQKGWSGLEDAGYGKGYQYSAEEFGKLLNLLSDVTEKGIHIVMTAHAWLRKIELPDEMGAYDHWEMKTSKKVAPMIREWADAVFFANYKTIVVNVDGQGAQKGKNKAQGGSRVMYTAHHPCWDAKNRYDLPDEMPFEYVGIAHIIETAFSTGTTKKADISGTSDPVKNVEDKNAEKVPSGSMAGTDKTPVYEEKTPTAGDGQNLFMDSDPDNIPQALKDLMVENKVTEWDIQNVVAAKGYYTSDVPIEKYNIFQPGFVEGVLIGAWPKVFAAIKSAWEKQEIPFN